MDSKPEFCWNEAKKIADQVVYQSTGKYLTDLEVDILRGSWDGKTYEQIAKTVNFTNKYLQNDVGAKLWRKLSDALQENISKNNFRQSLHRQWEKHKLYPLLKLENPHQPVPLNSPFYIERYSPQSQYYTIESLCFEAITQPTALLRIKAPRQMGKTSLLDRIIAQVHSYNYRTVRLNFRDVDIEKFNNIDTFLRWFCVYISQELDLKNNGINDIWKEPTIGSKINCKMYLQNHILKQINTPLVLAFDEVDWLFNYPEISSVFFSLLRSCHEEANNQNSWQKLRLIITHSTEDYGRLDINHSPFNVGNSIELTEFTSAQVKKLVQQHNLNKIDDLVPQLMEMVGGHPYLVRIALDNLVQFASEKCQNLKQLLEYAPTDQGIYTQHLHRHLGILRKNPNLAEAFKQVISNPKPITLDSIFGYQLYSMGLIKWQNNQVISRCLLYQKYFSERLMVNS